MACAPAAVTLLMPDTAAPVPVLRLAAVGAVALVEMNQYSEPLPSFVVTLPVMAFAPLGEAVGAERMGAVVSGVGVGAVATTPWRAFLAPWREMVSP